MKLIPFFAALALAAPAASQTPQIAPVALTPDSALLNVTAEGRSTRSPDLAVVRAGVVTNGDTASAAMAANSRLMAAALAALRRAGVADRDLQTSTLSLAPNYYRPQPQRGPGGAVQPVAPQIVGYEARNMLTVRVRKVDGLGAILDALVSAGVNELNGPSFTVDQPRAALDEARADALKTARARAELYAREAGYRTARILTISEAGGVYPLANEVVLTASRIGGVPPLPVPPVQGGEVGLRANLSVQFLLER